MSDDNTTGEQTIEQLQKRYNDLNTRKIQAETNFKNAEKQLDLLKQQAREKYKTDDIDELRSMLDEMTRENERKRREYQSSLDKIERDLDQVDQAFATAETTTDDDPSSGE